MFIFQCNALDFCFASPSLITSTDAVKGLYGVTIPPICNVSFSLCLADWTL